jgi:hypothetical protein
MHHGPNNNDNSFFLDLDSELQRDPQIPSIIGGDWNMTVSLMEGPLNIDILNMNNPPSLIRSRSLFNLCANHNLSDPFRCLHPDRRDYSYIPRAGTNNRSRMDFFIISDSVINSVKKCEIEPHLGTTLFDHKPICLTFTELNHTNNCSITNNTMNHPRFGAIVATAVVETYLHHAVQVQDPANGNFNIINFNDILGNVGNVCNLIRNINNMEWKEKLEFLSPEEIQSKVRWTEELTNIVNKFPDTATLNNLSLTTTPDIFFDVIANNIMNALKSFQGWLRKLNNAHKHSLKSRLEALKDNYTLNFNEIFQVENELNDIVERNLISKISALKIFENLSCENLHLSSLTLQKEGLGLGWKSYQSRTALLLGTKMKGKNLFLTPTVIFSGLQLGIHFLRMLYIT